MTAALAATASPPPAQPPIRAFLAILPDLLATTDAEGVQVHQFATGSITVPLAGGRVALRTSTAYPWDGDVDIEIDREPGPTLAALAQDPRLVPRCDRDAGRTSARDPPLARASSRWCATWSAGDRIALRLPMEPRVTVPDPRIDALRHTRGPGARTAGLCPRGCRPARRLLGRRPRGRRGAGRDAPSRDSSRASTTVSASPSAPVSEMIPRRPTWPYRSLPGPDLAASGSTPAASVKVEAIPYFAWANVPGLGMRVWLPVGPDGASPEGQSHAD